MTTLETVIKKIRECIDEIEKKLLSLRSSSEEDPAALYDQNLKLKYSLTGRYEINDEGQFLLTPDEGNCLTPVPWSGKTPNALTGCSAPYVSSGFLWFSPTATDRTYQLSCLTDLEITMQVTDIFTKAATDHLKTAFRPE